MLCCMLQRNKMDWYGVVHETQHHQRMWFTWGTIYKTRDTTPCFLQLRIPQYVPFDSRIPLVRIPPYVQFDTRIPPYVPCPMCFGGTQLCPSLETMATLINLTAASVTMASRGGVSVSAALWRSLLCLGYSQFYPESGTERSPELMGPCLFLKSYSVWGFCLIPIQVLTTKLSPQ